MEVPSQQAHDQAIPTLITNVDKFIRCKVEEDCLEDAFYTLDVSSVEKLFEKWQSCLPRVKPFYAVKCNPNPSLISVLKNLGAGFDVASKSEISTVFNLGVQPENIIFANPCKMNSHIRFAAKAGIERTTFDSESELVKLKKHHPDAKAVLRIRVSDHGAKIPLGGKFGAELDECCHLLHIAKKLEIDVVGVSFHVGSGAKHAKTFSSAIRNAHLVFTMAASLGLSFSLLDIGGGFVSDGGSGADFSSAAGQVNTALERYFPPEMNVRIIAEPGRFFAEEPFTLAVNVFGCRFRTSRDGKKTADYWINDGIYGSMNCVIFENTVLSPRVIFANQKGDREVEAEILQSTLFGPTCDSIDTVMKSVWLPELGCGDWIVFPRMGAYTTSAASSFNGFSVRDIKTFLVQQYIL